MVADILAKIRAAPAAHVPLASQLHGAPILPALPTLLRTVLKLGRAGETPATQCDASRSARSETRTSPLAAVLDSPPLRRGRFCGKGLLAAGRVHTSSTARGTAAIELDPKYALA